MPLGLCPVGRAFVSCLCFQTRLGPRCILRAHREGTGKIVQSKHFLFIDRKRAITIPGGWRELPRPFPGRNGECRSCVLICFTKLRRTVIPTRCTYKTTSGQLNTAVVFLSVILFPKQTAFYFAWMNFYFRWLLVPGIVGLLVTVHKVD